LLRKWVENSRLRISNRSQKEFNTNLVWSSYQQKFFKQKLINNSLEFLNSNLTGIQSITDCIIINSDQRTAIYLLMRFYIVGILIFKHNCKILKIKNSHNSVWNQNIINKQNSHIWWIEYFNTININCNKLLIIIIINVELKNDKKYLTT